MTATITPSGTSGARARVLQVASSFTSRPLARTLQPYLQGAGVADAVEFIEYGHVAEYMLGPAAEDEAVLGTLVLVRVEDALRSQVKSGAITTDINTRARQSLAVNVDEFAKQIASLAQRGKPVWLLACPSNGWIAEAHKLAPLFRTYTNLLLARVRGIPNLTVLNWPKSLEDPVFHDRNTDRLGQIPFTPAAFGHLAQFVGAEIETGFASRTASITSRSSNGKAELAKFLAGLELRVRMTPPLPAERAHVDRILRTAAAFSLAGEQPDLNDAEVDRMMTSDGCLLISVSDRLSSYGPSGVAVFRSESGSLIVEALALSCPVLGKQVEHAVVSGLAQVAKLRNCSRVVFEYKASARNQIMRKFLESVAGQAAEMRFDLPLAEAHEKIQKTAVAPGTWTLEFAT